MVIYTQVEVGGNKFDDADYIRVVNSIGVNNSSSNFRCVFPNHNGLHKDDFTIGDELIIYANKTNDIDSLLFPLTFPFDFSTRVITGLIEDIRFFGKEQDEEMILSGRDYTARLQDATVEPVVYNNQEVSVIVKDIMDNNVDGITTEGVDTTSTTLDHISFNHISVFDALKQLADVSGFIFWVDVNKVLNFKQKESIDSGFTLDNTNVLKSTFRESDQDMANEVWVYGDRRLTAWQNTFTADGAGSVFELDYKPHNTSVLVAGSTTPKKGGVFQLVDFAPSGVEYLIDYHNKKIIFVSGTNAGDNIPVSGDSITVDYDRSTPIIKYGFDRSSIETYGKKVKVIVDKNIKDPRLAKDVLTAELEENKLPKIQGNLSLQGIQILTAGKTVGVNLPNNGITNQTYEIIEVVYEFNKKNNLSEKVMRVKVSKKLKDVIDTIKQLMLDVKKIQVGDISTSDVITRLEASTGSAGVRVKEWYVKTRTIGDCFVLGHPVNGVLGSPVLGTGGSQVTLGSSTLSSFTVQYSGGEV